MNEASDAAARRPADPDYFLPDFCAPRMVLAIVLIAELLALMLALSRDTAGLFLTELARISVFAQWAALTSAAVLCSSAGWLRRLPVAQTSLAAFGLLVLNVFVLSVLAVLAGEWLQGRGVGTGIFPDALWLFTLRNVVIAAIVIALLLRYFFVSHQWRRHVRAEATARIDALHARIRPHFLFNSLNTIASLTRSDPVRAEEAIEDLSDLFRATLRESDATISLKEELELARIYQRMEALRLGDRLRVRWQIDGLPMRVQVPSLTVQPLLENAINHGIEPLAEGGTVEVHGWVDGDAVHLTLTNPAPARMSTQAAGGTDATAPAAPAAIGEGAEADGGRGRSRRGNRIALDNIRDRLRLAYADRAGLEISQRDDQFRVELIVPIEP